MVAYEKTGEKQRLFDTFEYQCGSWSHPRRLIAKTEGHQQGTTLRFVVTHRPGRTSAADGPREHDHSVQRGESEQRMDELTNGLKMDRLSGHWPCWHFHQLAAEPSTTLLSTAEPHDNPIGQWG